MKKKKYFVACRDKLLHREINEYLLKLRYQKLKTWKMSMNSEIFNELQCKVISLFVFTAKKV